MNDLTSPSSTPSLFPPPNLAFPRCISSCVFSYPILSQIGPYCYVSISVKCCCLRSICLHLVLRMQVVCGCGIKLLLHRMLNYMLPVRNKEYKGIENNQCFRVKISLLGVFSFSRWHDLFFFFIIPECPAHQE